MRMGGCPASTESMEPGEDDERAVIECWIDMGVNGAKTPEDVVRMAFAWLRNRHEWNRTDDDD